MVESFEINQDLLYALDEYHVKSMLLERHKIEKQPFASNLEEAIDDDLMYNIPIYDMGSRRYASFCSLTEALWKRENDVKGNGKFFTNHNIESEFDWFMLFYLFRLCGSGINYKPKISDTYKGTHGFGNFWIIDSINRNNFTHVEWLEDLSETIAPFTDNKGYLLPQFSFKDRSSGHLKYFILEYATDLVKHIQKVILTTEPKEIFQITDIGNKWLKERGFKAQNFVLTAFAADIAEYFPYHVDPKSRTYAGTNATKCIKAIFPKKKGVKRQEFDYINDVLAFQSERYELNPIDCEDSRNCDLIRYFQEYQSEHHIEKNNGVKYKNNSVLKKLWGDEKYYNFATQLK